MHKIYGLLGYPVKHSLSPLMHNAAFSALKLDAEYKLFEVPPQDLSSFFSNLYIEGIYGLNVTIPYKEKVISFLNDVSKEAQLIGAVNTIKVLGKRLEGFNTDGEGFIKHLTEDLNFNPKDKVISILGAGGAGKAISVFLSKYRPKCISIYDINLATAIALVGRLKTNFKYSEFRVARSIKELGIQNSDLLINATPIGMKEDDPCIVSQDYLHRNLLVYDLIYNPPQTKLLKLASQKGCAISNGLGMLLYQGALSFEIWTEEKAPLEIMRQALLNNAKQNDS